MCFKIEYVPILLLVYTHITIFNLLLLAKTIHETSEVDVVSHIFKLRYKYTKDSRKEKILLNGQ